MSSDIEIRRVDPEELKDRKTTFQYESDHHFKVEIEELDNGEGWQIQIRKTPFSQTFKKRMEEQTVKGYKGEMELYLAFEGDTEVGQINIQHQEWNNSVRVWDIDVWPGNRRKGIGTMLMDVAKKRARKIKARRIILETQSSNSDAISFYRSQGFLLAGMDVTNYSNEDMEKGEVRLEMAFYL